MKSDDVVGRVKTYEAIVKGQNIPMPGVPESFKVLIKELESLALDIKVLDRDKNEIIIKELDDEDEDLPVSTDALEALNEDSEQIEGQEGDEEIDIDSVDDFDVGQALTDIGGIDDMDLEGFDDIGLDDEDNE